jgi:Lrp/AsnC family leucine-responsive transcriptional regulator
MEEAGIIQGYQARIDMAGLGYGEGLIVMVTLDQHGDEVLHKFEQALAEIPEVIEAYLVSGEYDYFLRLAVRDTRDYERLLREKLYKIPGLRHSVSSFVLRQLKAASVPL